MSSVPRIGSGMRHHTPQAWRVGYAGRSKNAQMQNEAIDDLLLDIEQGDIDIHGVDWDGTPLLTLALRGWKENGAGRALWNNASPHTRLQYPLPGEAWKQNASVDMAWQRPAAAMIALGADPFIDWPKTGQHPWASPSQSPLGVQEDPRCPFFQALRVQAWGVVEQMLRHPKCPKAEQLDTVVMPSGRGLLSFAATLSDKALLALLLQQGMNTERVDAQGCTALFYAQEPHQVQALLSAGARPSHVNIQGDNAPAFWGASLKNANLLVKEWEGYAAQGESADGRMVVQSLRANSLSGFRSALKASGWDIARPITDQPSSLRLLPAAALVMLQTMSGPSALPLRVLSHLVDPGFKEVEWTVEEKAWAACALEACVGLSLTGWAFTTTSSRQAREVLKDLVSDPQVVSAMPQAFASLLESFPTDHHRLPHVWEGWMKSLPTRQHPQRWESLAMAWKASSDTLEEVGRTTAASDCVAAWIKDKSALLPSANALHGLLAWRSTTSLSKDLRAAFDAKWMDLWPFSGGKLDASLPWMQAWMNGESGRNPSELVPFRQLLLEQDFEAAPSVRGPRL